MSAYSLLFPFYHTLSFCAFTINTFNSQQSYKKKKNHFSLEKGVYQKKMVLFMFLGNTMVISLHNSSWFPLWSFSILLSVE